MGQAQSLQRPVVLVVEDEPLLRMMAADLVEEAGFDVIEAADADEAVRVLESGANIRIVFTDIDMPGSMDGLLLAAAIRDRWPPIDIILTSGHVHVNEVALPHGSVFFSKPYDHQRLATTLHSFVEARPA